MVDGRLADWLRTVIFRKDGTAMAPVFCVVCDHVSVVHDTIPADHDFTAPPGAVPPAPNG